MPLPAPASAHASSAPVQASGLGRRYGRRWALVDVSFTVPRGALFVVAGRNGSGKSTLLRVLATAIRADRGTATIEGKDLRTEAVEVRRRVAFLSHQTHLYEPLTALENLQVAARFLRRDARPAALLPLLARVGLAERAGDSPATFSAGMRRRLSLARILLKGASVFLLDEPYGLLDPPGFRLVDGFLASLRDRGATVLMATHLLERAGELGDVGIVLEAGRIAWAGPSKDLVGYGGLEATGLPDERQ
jgi:heme exporter protein A